MKYFFYTMTGLFLLFTYWQLNDATQYHNHDNWFWIVYYLCAAVLTFLEARKEQPTAVYTGMIGFSVGAALFRMQDGVGNFDFSTPLRATAIPSQMNATIQAPNETGGLLLVGAWFIFLAIRAAKRRKEAQ
ncbi:Transmembrane family 220, helix [Rubritalea squalenifaciens DSM 18772]|uniref:Transmembrane family 220, helix n=2 Tax=Rubritalea TaxID=361050 RepID=A0A1M6M314_9BACT|nr:transmembrane 220 family protein [Rubritalea squalenifaciens]SHJ77839.1 Transmembrane family 220, helix [Rubritalea squalenifaciens DSM 18772]